MTYGEGNLIYLDPSFNSNATYNVLFKEHNSAEAAVQIKAFGDTWGWDEAAVASRRDVGFSPGAAPVGSCGTLGFAA